MKITFLGVGEAVDENYGNTSILIEEKINMLLDCGFSAPQPLWKLNPDPEFLNAIYISHQHADHSFGITPLLLRMYEDGRKKPLVIIGQNIESLVRAQFDIGYKGFLKKISYPLEFRNIVANSKITTGTFNLEFSRTSHSIENLAIKITSENTSICYSGDGKIIPSTKAFFSNANLVIIETKFIDKVVVGHSTVVSAIVLAKKCNIKQIAMVHLDRSARKQKENLLARIKESGVNAFVPEPGDSINL